MTRKFECKNCGKSFSVEERGQVNCPHCGSDNVDYASIHIPYKLIGIIALLALTTIILLKIDYSNMFSEDLRQEKKSDNADSTVVDNLETIEEMEEMGITFPPIIIGTDKMELDDNGNYNVVVKLEHVPKNDYSVVISDIRTNKEVVRSNDGIFKGVPYSENDGKYYAQIVSISADTALSERTEITGFVKIENISHAMTARELQDLINKQDPTLLGHDNKYLSPVCQIKYEKSIQGIDYLPDNLADVFEMLNMGAWTSVEVTSVEYDKTKHISSIALKVKVPSRPDFGN